MIRYSIGGSRLRNLIIYRIEEDGQVQLYHVHSFVTSKFYDYRNKIINFNIKYNDVISRVERGLKVEHL